MTVLDEIIAYKRAEAAASRSAVSPAEMRERAAAAPPGRAFGAAITGPPVRVIAEVKRASPSQGTIRPDADPVAMAHVYEQAGAAAARDRPAGAAQGFCRGPVSSLRSPGDGS